MIEDVGEPGATASSTTYWIDGLSTTGSISFGWLLVAGRNRVPEPRGGDHGFADAGIHRDDNLMSDGRYNLL